MPDTTVAQNEKFELFKVSKRRSCELVNTPSPCVHKALFHLERLKVFVILSSVFGVCFEEIFPLCR